MTQALRMTLIQTKTDSDQVLLQRITDGDEDALRALYAAHGVSMYAFALRLTNDPASAEEAVQESLVAVWQGAGDYRGNSRIITWLLGIVHHKALNLLRKREDISLDEQHIPLPSSNQAPGYVVETHERNRLVREGLEQLPKEQRSVLELVFFHRLSMEEAARVLECPAGTVKSRLFAAKNSLKGVLTRQGFRLEDLI